jgi:ABC-type Na+ transport system ATPase subunit NatA
MLTISNLSKTYPNGVRALRDVSLEIPNGMFGLIGFNGAGKSTLMRTIATLQEPDEGAIALNGIDVLNDKQKVREVLGYLPQEFGVYPKVSAQAMLDHLALLKGLTVTSERRDEVEMLLRMTNLWKVRKQRLGTFSGGMRQRFGIAQALLGDPRDVIEGVRGMIWRKEVSKDELAELAGRVLVIFAGIGAATTIASQLAAGYTRLEPGLYAGGLVLMTIPYVFCAVLAVFALVLARSKFFGYLAVLFYLFLDDRRLGYRIVRLAEPMAPGATLEMDFELEIVNPGFVNNDPNDQVVANGTLFTSRHVMPTIGYREWIELEDRNKRRKYGLEPHRRLAAIDDVDAYRNNELGPDADLVSFRATANFGPYQFRQVRILEFPRYETFAMSLPNTIPYSEAKELEDGRYLVRMAVEARKLRSDGRGLETEVPLDDWIDVGVFGPDDEVLFLEKRRITGGSVSFEITVDGRPEKAGIDPYNKLVDRDSNDNVMRVREG